MGESRTHEFEYASMEADNGRAIQTWRESDEGVRDDIRRTTLHRACALAAAHDALQRFIQTEDRSILTKKLADRLRESRIAACWSFLVVM